MPFYFRCDHCDSEFRLYTPEIDFTFYNIGCDECHAEGCPACMPDGMCDDCEPHDYTMVGDYDPENE